MHSASFRARPPSRSMSQAQSQSHAYRDAIPTGDDSEETLLDSVTKLLRMSRKGKGSICLQLYSDKTCRDQRPETQHSSHLTLCG
jgi:hypothetical protein